MLKMLRTLSLMVVAALVLVSALVGCATMNLGGTASYDYIQFGGDSPLAFSIPVPAGTPDFSKWGGEMVGQRRGKVAEMVAFRYAQENSEDKVGSSESYLLIMIGYRTNGKVTKVIPIVLSHLIVKEVNGDPEVVLDENWMISADLKSLDSFPADEFENRVNELFIRYCDPPAAKS